MNSYLTFFLKTWLKNSRSTGFTLIEALVAITVLVIGVLGPMSLLSRALADANAIKNEVIATQLAQEGTELLISARDAGQLLWAPSTGYFRIDNPSVSTLTFTSCGDCSLKEDNGLYNYTSGSRTPFIWKLKVDPVGSGLVPEEKMLTSVVSWTEKGIPKSVTSVSYVYASY